MDSPLTPTGERHAMIAGALFDFLGKASSGTEPVIRGDMVPVIERLRSWAAERGLDLDLADVQHWHEHLPG